MKKRSPQKSEVSIIKDARGALTGKPGAKSFRERWSDYKKEEKALEEAKYARLRPR